MRLLKDLERSLYLIYIPYMTFPNVLSGYVVHMSNATISILGDI